MTSPINARGPFRSRIKPVLLSIGFLVTSSLLRAEQGEEIAIWPKTPPGTVENAGAERVRVTEAGDHVVSNVHRPSLTVYLPSREKATGAAVLVIPGGGHRELWMDHEGHQVARWLNDRGIAAFILKYRLAREEGSTYSVEGHALPDAQRAMKLIRHRAVEWKVDPRRLGVMGFSAGGELASLVAMRYDLGQADAADEIERENSRPAFQALVYPGHASAIIPNKESPPVFLVCGFEDRPDISEGLASVYLSFKKVGVPAELHIFSDAGHGFGVRETNRGPASKWLDRFYEWAEMRGFFKTPNPSFR